MKILTTILLLVIFPHIKLVTPAVTHGLENDLFIAFEEGDQVIAHVTYVHLHLELNAADFKERLTYLMNFTKSESDEVKCKKLVQKLATIEEMLGEEGFLSALPHFQLRHPGSLLLSKDEVVVNAEINKVNVVESGSNEKALDLISSELSDELATWENVVIQAMQERLSAKVSHLINAEDVFSNLKTAATHKGLFVSPSFHLAHLWQLETSFFIKDGVFHFLTHVPFSRKSAIMEMKVLKIAHLHFPDSDLIVEFKPQKRILALSQDEKTFVTLDSDELAKCSKVGKNHFCPHLNIVNMIASHLKNSCLGSLWDISQSNPLEQCSFEILQDKSILLSLSTNEFLSFEKDRSPLDGNCIDLKYLFFYPKMYKGSTFGRESIEIGKNCKYYNKNVVFTTPIGNQLKNIISSTQAQIEDIWPKNFEYSYKEVQQTLLEKRENGISFTNLKQLRYNPKDKEDYKVQSVVIGILATLTLLNILLTFRLLYSINRMKTQEVKENGPVEKSVKFKDLERKRNISTNNLYPPIPSAPKLPPRF